MHHENHDINTKHYICRGGCHGVSDKAGVCMASDCADNGKALHECSCHDEKHSEDVIINN